MRYTGLKTSEALRPPAGITCHWSPVVMCNVFCFVCHVVRSKKLPPLQVANYLPCHSYLFIHGKYVYLIYLYTGIVNVSHRYLLTLSISHRDIQVYINTYSTIHPSAYIYPSGTEAQTPT